MIQVVDIPVWSEKKIKAFVEKRIELHKDAKNGRIQPCTDEEKWTKDHVWAVMKKGRKSAVKLYKDKKELPKLDAEQYIQFRKGESLRCKHYCDVRDFCPQYEKETVDG